MWSGGNSPIHWLAAPNKRRCGSQQTTDTLDLLLHEFVMSRQGDVRSTSSESFAVEVNPTDVYGCLDGVEEAPMVDVC